ncbi:MAG: hypothetical protein ACK5TN_23140 [Acidobacteriota bacterium]
MPSQANWLLPIGSLILAAALPRPLLSADPSQFRRIEPQFIAALGAPGASSGNGAQSWGLWSLDPGPRGHRLERFEQLTAAADIAPAGWKFDPRDWWLEEHGLIMESPTFPLSPGKYLVTGDRQVTAVLTVHPKDKNGNQRWDLSGGATLYDVTHLGCRAARYSPAAPNNSCSPANVPPTGFPVYPDAAMPAVKGCRKLDYAVLIIVGLPASR